MTISFYNIKEIIKEIEKALAKEKNNLLRIQIRIKDLENFIKAHKEEEKQRSIENGRFRKWVYEMS